MLCRPQHVSLLVCALVCHHQCMSLNWKKPTTQTKESCVVGLFPIADPVLCFLLIPVSMLAVTETWSPTSSAAAIYL